jgi:squalene-hopene/tetraprenyl-beta-curcumene cyclase
MLFGVDKNLPNMLLAKKFILAKGGLPKVRVFTKIWLALFGQWPWHKIPMIPPELIHLPAWFPINIYEFASWARATIVPLTIVMVKRPLKDIPESCKINDLLPNGSKYTGTKIGGGWKAFFWLVEKALQAYEYSPWKPASALDRPQEFPSPDVV